MADRERRAELCAVLAERVRLAAAGGDAAALLEPEVTRQIRELSALLDQEGFGDEELPARRALGWAHWLRAHAGPADGEADGEPDDAELQAVFGLLFAPFLEGADLEGLPGDLIAWLVGTVTVGAIGMLEAAHASPDPGLADRAVDVWRRFVRALPEDDPRGIAATANLGAALNHRFGLSADVADLDESADRLERAVEAMGALPAEHRAALLTNLGNALRFRYLHTGRRADLDRALEVGRTAVAVADPAAAVGRQALSNLGDTLQMVFDETDESSVLEEAVEVGRRAVAAEPDGRGWAVAASNLGNALRVRFARLGAPEDLDEAVAVLERARRAGDGGPARALATCNLAGALHDRYRSSRNTGDLDRAVDLAQEALTGASGGSPDRPIVLTILAEALRDRYALTGRRTDLDEAVSYAEQAAASTGDDHPQAGQRQVHATDLRGHRFGITAAPKDLDAAVADVRRRLADAAPGERPLLLNELSHVLYSRYQRGGALPDLEDAIGSLRDAIAAVPAVDARHGPFMLLNLSTLLQTRAEHADRFGGADEAVSAARQALGMVEADDPQRPSFLLVLADALQGRFTRTGRRADLDEALAFYREAVASAPDAPLVGTVEANMALALTCRADHTGGPDAVADLDEAIGVLARLVHDVPVGHVRRPALNGNLGNALHARHERTGAPADLDAALLAWRAALEATPNDHPDHAKFAVNLGRALRSRFAREGRDADRAEAVELLVGAAGMSAAAPPVRAAAARYASELLATSQPALAQQLLEQTMMLPQVPPWWQERPPDGHSADRPPADSVVDGLSPRHPEEHPSENPPLPVSAYLPIRVLRGTATRVYICETAFPRDGSIVAVKRLDKPFTEIKNLPEMFMRECYLWLRLGGHPNLVQVIHVHYSPQDVPLLVMEYLPRSLRSLLRGEPLPEEEVMPLALNILDGLIHALSTLEGFVHGDLKPENVLISSDGVAKLTDLGLSRSAEEALISATMEDFVPSSGAAASLSLEGTALYMAPEQVLGRPASVYSDVYSWACMVYELLTGSPVYGRPDGNESYRQRHLTAEPERPDDVDPRLSELVLECLEKDPENRPHPRDVRSRLAAVMASRGLPTEQPRAAQPDIGLAYAAAQGLSRLGFHEEGLEAARELRERTVEFPEVWAMCGILMAGCLTESSRYQEAADILEEVRARQAEYSETARSALLSERAAVAMGRSHQLMLEARRLSEEALSLAPDTGRTWFNLATIRYALRDVDGAIEAMDRSLLFSKSTQSFVRVVSWLSEARRHREAINYAHLAVARHPQDGAAYGARTTAFLRSVLDATSGLAPVEAQLEQALADADLARRYGISADVGGQISGLLDEVWKRVRAQDSPED
ncbi:protein kinase domain-containing protein [Actinomadura chibensis]|uniref:serine/threonine-protein kinase n=1 Tax=Actinomadura chibensis TaxID=392828 RepID=UPI0008355C0B|nr:serine/threonine-protein kinase [Actinomadura chibensis]